MGWKPEVTFEVRVTLLVGRDDVVEIKIVILMKSLYKRYLYGRGFDKNIINLATERNVQR